MKSLTDMSELSMVVGQKSWLSNAAVFQNPGDTYCPYSWHTGHCQEAHILLPNPNAISNPLKHRFGKMSKPVCKMK